MSTMDTVSFRVDRTTKDAVTRIVNDFGLDLSTMLRMLMRQIAMRREIPLTLSYPSPDPFFSESNLAALRESLEQLERGETVRKSLDELRAME